MHSHEMSTKTNSNLFLLECELDPNNQLAVSLLKCTGQWLLSCTGHYASS
jgi:hypothetical protein